MFNHIQMKQGRHITSAFGHRGDLMNVQVVIRGYRKVMTNLRRLPNKIEKEIINALNIEQLQIMHKSKREVPVDTGALRRSAYTEKPKKIGKSIIGVIGYSGKYAKINPKTGQSTEKYAIAVHETNKNYRNGRKWKYLSDPLEVRKPNLLRNMAKIMRRRINNLVR